MADLTEWQAFVAMFHFLEEYWEQNSRTGEVSGILSEIGENARPGHTADPATWGEWLKAVEWSRARSENLTVSDEREGDDLTIRMPRKQSTPK